MKKLFYLFVLVFTLTACEKHDLERNLHDSGPAAVAEDINQPLRPIVLGKQLNNPFSVENMQIALDSLLANSESLNAGYLGKPLSWQHSIIRAEH